MTYLPAEAENLLLRAQLMPKIKEICRGTTQTEAAKLFGVSQPRLKIATTLLDG